MEVEIIDGVPTHVLSLRSKNCGDEASSRRTPLVLIIPGSPGMGHFYIPFAYRLFHMSGGKYDVSIVSHAGHSPGHYKDLTHLSFGCAELEKAEVPREDWYTLQDQINHKLAFVQKEASIRDSVILIGHSIGCWMILQMLRKLPPSRVSQVFLLFPTIEKMSLTPNAQSCMSHVWSSLRIPFISTIWILSNLIPDCIKKCVVKTYFFTTPSEHLEFVTQGAINIDHKTAYNITKMARQEMDEVVNPPLEVIDENIDKIVFYYGVGDRWTVESCYRDMAARYPDKEVHLCKHNFPHAFVTCASDEMAEFVFSKMFF